MKKILLLTVFAGLTLSAQAQTPADMKGKMQMNPASMEKHMRNRQEYGLKMHEYYNRILAEQDPAKQQQLKDEQLELMKQHHKQKMQHKMKMKQMRRQMKQMSDNEAQ